MKFFDEPTVTGFLGGSKPSFSGYLILPSSFCWDGGMDMFVSLEIRRNLGKTMEIRENDNGPIRKGRRVLEIPLYPLSCSGGAEASIDIPNVG